MKFGIFALPTYFPEVDGTIGEFYEHILELLVTSERLGFGTAWVNEHHFHAYGGMIPDPPVLLAALAARTKTLRIGTSVSLLPLHHPLQLAEAYAMLDQLSGGRLDLGVGRGFVEHDYDSFHVPWDEGQPRMIETLDVMLKAWQERPFEHQGKFFEYHDVEVWPPPRQTPHPPVWLAASRTPESFAWAGRRGFHLLTVAYLHPHDHLRSLIDLYREEVVANGHDLSRLQIGTHFQVYCAETREEARRVGGEAFERYGRLLTEARTRSFLDPAAGHGESIDALVDAARLCIGTPDDCAAVIAQANENLGGLQTADCTFYYGGLDYAQARRSHELFAREVIPRFQHQEATAPVG